MKLIVTLLCLLLAVCFLSAPAAMALPSNCTVGTNVYYVDNIGGSDGNTQTQAKNKGTPWAHAPYQHSFTGSYTHTAGDCFIFKGGETWNVGTTDYFVVPNGGASGNADYYGFDITWFTGSNWNRPIMDIQSSFPNTDAFHNATVFALQAAWVTFDSFEIINGKCQLTPTQTNLTVFATEGHDGITVTNSYFHDFNSQSGGCGSGKVSNGNASGNNFAVWLYMSVTNDGGHGSFDHNVVDGTDGTGVKGYETIVMDPATAAVPSFNVMHDICSGVAGNMNLIHDNLIYNFGYNANPGTCSVGGGSCTGQGSACGSGGTCSTFDCGSTGVHAHAIRTQSDANVYNNVVHDVNDGIIKTNPTSGVMHYIFNNLSYHNGYVGFAWDDIDLCDNGGSSCANGKVAVWNNTLECVQDNGAVAACFRLENPANTLLLQNEHHIGLDTSGGLSGTGNATTYTPSNNLFQPEGSGTGGANQNVSPTFNQYTLSQPFIMSPVLNSNSSVGAGINLTSSWPAGITTNSTTYACSQGTVSGVVQVVCPALTSTTRAASGSCTPGTTGCWDIGAYMQPLSTGTYTITISSITGHGTITSSDSVINCGTGGSTPPCTDPTASGTVTLTETPASGYIFTSWGGSCSGSLSTCAVNSAATVTATFTLSSGPTPGTCANFALGVCPAAVPSGVTSFYFIDYVSGLDSNTGGTETTAFQHLPCGANASGNAATACTSGSGVGWIFKGGVTVDFHSWPANVPFGGASGSPTYIGPDPGWFTGSAWARPIFSGGGSSFNADTVGFLLSDATDHTSYFVLDNIEFTGFFWNTATNCYVQSSACGYVGYYNHSLNSGTDVSWEFKNFYAHNITHAAYGATTTNDQAPYGLFWMPRDSLSSAHDFVIDNTDGGEDCCGSVTTGNMYDFYLTGLTNGIYNPTTSSSGQTIFLVHDFTIVNPVATFQTGNGVHGTTAPHENCIHVFGNQASTYDQLFYNGRIDCTNSTAEPLEQEEDASTTYLFNLVVTNEYQPNGFDTSFFSSTSLGGNYNFFDITEECGQQNGTFGPYPCFALRGSPTVHAYNMFGIATHGGSGPTNPLVCELTGCGDLTGNFTGTFTSAPNSTIVCGSSTTTNFGGNIICAPIGTGNGTGNLNLTQTYPYAPLDPTAGATVGTSSATATRALCSTISGINTAAGLACLSDTTLGVTYNTSNHTVSTPARVPQVRPTTGNWQNGAYQAPIANPPAPAAIFADDESRHLPRFARMVRGD